MGHLKVSTVFKYVVVPGSVMVNVLAIGPKVRGYKPGRERWISKGDNNP
jgi:hypothetical protein